MRQYFSHWGLDFSGDPRTLPVLARHHISKEVATALVDDHGSYVEIEFKSDADRPSAILVSQDGIDQDSIIVRDIAQAAVHLQPLSTPPVRPAFWRTTTAGLSRVGGPPPDGFRMPPAAFYSGYQFIGMINRREPLSQPPKTDIPLLYPMFVAHPACFWDVSDPLAPRLFDPKSCYMMNLDNPDEPHPIVTDHWPSPIEEDGIAEVFAGGGAVEYKAARIGLAGADLPVPPFEYVARASLPGWVQTPEIPICPRTGEPMLFLAELEFGLPIARNDVKDAARNLLDDDSLGEYFSGMRFWGGLATFYSLPPGWTKPLSSSAGDVKLA